MRSISLHNIIWKEDKYYVAQCLNVDVSSFGKTRKEAQKNLDEALSLYFEDTPRPHVSRIRMPRLVACSFQHV